MDTSSKIGIILAEDHRIMRQGLRQILEQAPDFQIVGEAENGNQAIELVMNLHPDILICDIRMPLANGIVVSRKVKKTSPKTKIIILSAYDDDEYVLELMRAGASAYLLKNVDKHELIDSVRKVFSGATVLQPEIAAKIARLWDDAVRDRGKQQELTLRETEILGLAAGGLKTRAIADKLNLSVRTVEHHFQNIMDKLSVSSRTEAISYCLKKKIIELL